MAHTVVSTKPLLRTADRSNPDVLTLLICRNILLRTGIRQILSGTRFALTDDILGPASDLSVFARNESVLILLCESLAPDAYLETLGRLKVQCPSARVVVLADRLEPDAVVRLYEAGLNGLCSPAMVGSGLVRALELVIAGEIFLPAVIGLALLEQLSHPAMPDAHAVRTAPQSGLAGRLSERETQILRCLMQGASNKEIGRQLDLAEATVKVHIKSILRKIRAANRTQAAMWAQQHLQMKVEGPG
jgi:two-component system nitrate/nitrite response regulator NarL